jgi:hypothetical protein
VRTGGRLEAVRSPESPPLPETMKNRRQIAVDARPLGEVPLRGVLHAREVALAEMWDGGEAENPESAEANRYLEASFELSLRELMCEIAGKYCRGRG